MEWVYVGILIVAIGASCLLGAGVGHFHGYQSGFEDGSRKQAGIWKDRLAVEIGKREKVNGKS